MTTKIRPRTIAVLAAFVGLLGVVAVTIPSSGAAEPSVVRLNLGSDGRYFEYGTERQNLSTQNNSCEVKAPAPNTPNIMALSSSPNQSTPGLGPDGIGVKLSRSSGNGTPCTQVEAAETLTLAPGATLGSKLFKSVRLDLEMTGDAKVILKFSGGATGTTPDVYELQTGTSIQQAQKDEWTPADKLPPYLVSSGPGDQVDACAAPNSSGPNSGGNDNCQWTIVPAKTFSTVTLTTTQGTVSLEGGGDFPSAQDRDSLFVHRQLGPDSGRRQSIHQRGHDAERKQCPGQRQRPEWRPHEGRACRRYFPREPVTGRERHIHLRAGSQLQRAGLVHVQGQRRNARVPCRRP